MAGAPTSPVLSPQALCGLRKPWVEQKGNRERRPEKEP